MYWLPSASQRREPSPRTMKGGSPPTARKARTGELTPPGMTASARFCSWREWSSLRAMGPQNEAINIAAEAGGRRASRPGVVAMWDTAGVGRLLKSGLLLLSLLGMSARAQTEAEQQ